MIVLRKKHWFIALILLFAAVLIFLLFRFKRDADVLMDVTSTMDSNGSHIAISLQTQAKVAEIEAKERRMNETVWAKEMLAEECGRTFEIFWDSLNASTNKLALAASF